MALEAFRCFSSNIGFDLPATDNITSIETWDSCVYLGTKQGTVYQYVREHVANANLDHGDDGAVEKYQSMSRVVVGKKPIVGLKALSRQNLLMIHTDSKLTFYDLKTLKRTKHAEIYYVGGFAVDPNTNQLCLGVKGKKKLYIYSWHGQKEDYVFTKELGLPHFPLALAWVSSRVCVGISDNYILVNPPDGKIFTLSFLINHPPLMATISNEVCVFTSDVGIYITPTGEPSKRPPVAFSSEPQTVSTVTDQYLIGLSDGVMEVVSTLENKVVQRPTLDILCDQYPQNELPISPPSLSGASDPSIPQIPLIASHNTSLVVYLPHQNHILTLHNVPIKVQIQQYLTKLLMDEALVLLKRKNPSPKEIDSFHVMAGLELIQALQFHRAFDHFTIANIAPSQLIFSLFPHIMSLPIGTNPRDQLIFEYSLTSTLSMRDGKALDAQHTQKQLQLNQSPSLGLKENLTTQQPQHPDPKFMTTTFTSNTVQNRVKDSALQSVNLLQLLKNGRSRYISRLTPQDFQEIDNLDVSKFTVDEKTQEPSQWPLALSYSALYSLLLWYLTLFLSHQRTVLHQKLALHYKLVAFNAKQTAQGYVMSDDYYAKSSRGDGTGDDDDDASPFGSPQSSSSDSVHFFSPQKLAELKQELIYIDNALLFLTLHFTALYNPHFSLTHKNSYNLHPYSLLSYMFPYHEADGFSIKEWYQKARLHHDNALDLYHFRANLIETTNKSQVQQQLQNSLISSPSTLGLAAAIGTAVMDNTNPPPSTFPLYLAQQALIMMPRKTRTALVFIYQNTKNDQKNKKGSDSSANSKRYHDDPNLQLATPVDGLGSIRLQAYPLSTSRLMAQGGREDKNSKNGQNGQLSPTSQTQSLSPISLSKTFSTDSTPSQSRASSGTSPTTITVNRPAGGTMTITDFASSDNNNNNKTTTRSGLVHSGHLLDPSKSGLTGDHIDPESVSGSTSNNTSFVVVTHDSTQSSLHHLNDKDVNGSEPVINVIGEGQSTRDTTPTTSPSHNLAKLSSFPSGHVSTSNLHSRKYLSYFPFSIQSLLSSSYCTPIYFLLLLSYYDQWYALAFWYVQRHILSQQYLYRDSDAEGLTAVSQQLKDLPPLTHPSTLSFLDGSLSPLLQALHIYYRLSQLYTGPLTSTVAPPDVDLAELRSDLSLATSSLHDAISSTSKNNNNNDLSQFDNVGEAPKYGDFIHFGTKLIKSTIDIIEYEDVTGFLPNFYLDRKISPPMGIMAFILRYKAQLGAEETKKSPAIRYDDDSSSDEDLDLDFDHQGEGDNDNIGGSNLPTIEDVPTDDDERDDAQHLLFQVDSPNGDEDEPDSDAPRRKKKGSIGPVNEKYHLGESYTQEVTLHSTSTPGELIIFDFYPAHKHTTSQSASYREALANANANNSDGKGIQQRKSTVLGGYLKMSALKKTAKFLYNPFKRRQHWSQNTSSKKGTEKDSQDHIGPALEQPTTNYKNDYSKTPMTSAMGLITTFDTLDVYQLHNALCPDFFNIQLAFDLYFAQQQPEPTNTVAGHFYHMAYYQCTSPLFYAMQLLENQQFWYLFYQVANSRAGGNSFESAQNNGQSNQNNQNSQNSAQNDSKNTLVSSPSTLGSSGSHLQSVVSKLVCTQPMRINNDYIPSSWYIHQTQLQRQLHPDQAPSPSLTPSQRRAYYTDRPLKSLQFFPPLDLINQYLGWGLEISPSLFVPLLSSLWLSLLIDFNTSASSASRSASLSAQPISGNIMNTIAQAQPAEQQVRKVARSAVISKNTESKGSDSKLMESSSTKLDQRSPSSKEKPAPKGSMHMVISPTAKVADKGSGNEATGTVKQEAFELLVLQDLFTILLVNDSKYRSNEGLASTSTPTPTPAPTSSTSSTSTSTSQSESESESFLSSLYRQFQNNTYRQKNQQRQGSKNQQKTLQNDQNDQNDQNTPFISPTRPLPFRSTNRLITVYTSSYELQDLENSVGSSVQSRGNWNQAESKLTTLLNQLSHYDETTPPFFITLLTYLLHAMNAANGFYPVTNAATSRNGTKKEPEKGGEATGTPIQYLGGGGILVAPGLNNVATTSYNIQTLFSVLLPEEALKGPVFGAMGTSVGGAGISASQKLVDTLLLALIKQLRRVESSLDLAKSLEGTVPSAKAGALALSSAAATLVTSHNPSAFQYSLKQATGITSDDDTMPDSTALVMADPIFLVTRLNNTLIKLDDFTALLTILQSSYVTTITDIISSPAFYPEPTKALVEGSRTSGNIAANLTSDKSAFITAQYGPSVESILTSIRPESDSSTAGVLVESGTARGNNSSGSGANKGNTNSLHHCCLTLEARLGHHRDVINLYLFTLMDIDGGLSYVRVVHQQQKASGTKAQGTQNQQNQQQNQQNQNQTQNQTQTQPQKVTEGDELTTPIFLLFLQILMSSSYQAHLESKIIAYQKQYQTDLAQYHHQVRRLTKKHSQSPQSTILDPSTGEPLLPPVLIQMPTWHDTLMYVFSTHAHFLTPFLSHVIRLLPPSLPVAVILPCLEQTLPDLQHNYNHNVLMANFAKRGFVERKIQNQLLKKSYTVLTEPQDIPSGGAGAGGNNQRRGGAGVNANAKGPVQKNQDQVCILCNRLFLQGTIPVSIPLQFLLWLDKNHPDVFMLNQQGQKDAALPPALKRNGVVDVYGNNVMLHYNCTTRIDSYLQLWNTPGRK